MELRSSIKILLALPASLVVGFFYYPLQLRVLPLNSKTILAICGLIVIVMDIFKNRDGVMRRDFFELSMLALFVSFFSLFSIIINGTDDSTYLTYIISMWVWLSAGYCTISFIRGIYGTVTVVMLCDFLIIASLIQCISAIAIDLNLVLRDFVDRFVDHRWTESVDRLYGISAELDTAGIHFAVVLIMIAYILGNNCASMPKWKIYFYWLSLVFITVIGNMIARTTLTGTILAIIYLVWRSGILLFKIKQDQKRILSSLFITLVLSIPIIVYYYNTNTRIYENIRFGFEGFFSLIEKGEWSVASNQTLKNMIVYPETLKTWITGDGYILNPKYDSNYMGPITPGYYMNTDIGYLRFIFYFGLPGLLSFSLFIIMSGVICAQRLPHYKIMIYGLVVLNFIIWLKVSTDLFFIFALLCYIDEQSVNRIKYDNSKITYCRQALS